MMLYSITRVTRTLIGANVAMFIAELLLGDVLNGVADRRFAFDSRIAASSL